MKRPVPTVSIQNFPALLEGVDEKIWTDLKKKLKSSKDENILSNKDKEDFEKALFLFFRKNCLNLQHRFVEIFDVSRIPRVFLHGNPHLDNYAKTMNGEAMVDFDRSRIGPYSWDVVRFLCSLSLKSKDFDDPKLLSKKVLEAFLAGYVYCFNNPYKEKLILPELLGSSKPKNFEKSVDTYLKENVRWAKKMREMPLDPEHIIVRALVEAYLQGRNEQHLLSSYIIEEAGLARGSFGKARFLVVLAPKLNTKGSLFGKIFLEIKEVYRDQDTACFFNPYVHHGMRMIEASHLYAPRMEEGLSYLTFMKSQFWGRRIPPFKRKLKGQISNNDYLADIGFRIGYQLGRAHSKSLKELSHQKFVNEFLKSFDSLVKVSIQLNKETIEAFKDKKSLAPKKKESTQKSLALIKTIK